MWIKLSAPKENEVYNLFLNGLPMIQFLCRSDEHILLNGWSSLLQATFWTAFQGIWQLQQELSDRLDEFHLLSNLFVYVSFNLTKYKEQWTCHIMLIWLTGYVVFMTLNMAAKSSEKNELVCSLSYPCTCFTIFFSFQLFLFKLSNMVITMIFAEQDPE